MELVSASFAACSIARVVVIWSPVVDVRICLLWAVGFARLLVLPL